MLKALFRKKLQELRARQALGLFPLLFFLSLSPLVGLWFGTPPAMFLAQLPIVGFGCFLGLVCAGTAFEGEFAHQANRFLEYLPVRRSALWLACYLSGLALLALAAISLFWLDLVLFPVRVDPETMARGPRPDRLLEYLVPGRLALAASVGSILVWAYSVAVFPVAYLGKRESQTGAGQVGMILTGIALAIAILVTLGMLRIMPSGLALSPVLLASAALYSAGSFALFALVPRHIAPWKHGLLGFGLFVAISAVLLGQLYWKHLTWRVFDPSLPFHVQDVYRANVEGEPDLVLADVFSYRSFEHCVSLDVERAAYHDLGRGLTFVEVPEDDSGLLHFLRDYHGMGRSRDVRFTRMAPDATGVISFDIPHVRWVSTQDLRWLPDKGLLVYRADFEDVRVTCLCVADATGTLLRRFAIGGYTFLVSAAGQALAIAPRETPSDAIASTAPQRPEEPYMRIDVESGSVDRFGLPGQVVYFAKDLSRVICSRRRVEAGRQYTSYVVVELPSLEERLILSEAEFPAEEITSPVAASVEPRIATEHDQPAPFLRVNDAFDRALWIKQRVEGDHFRSSIVVIDLDTAEQTVVVPESATPSVPVVSIEGTVATPITIRWFTADGAGFTYTIGLQTYLCDFDSRESVLLADNSIRVEGDEEDPEGPDSATSPPYYSPSGRRVLRTANVWQKPANEGSPGRFKFAAIEVFENGKPVRLYTGQRPVQGALWLDDERIVFYEDEAIYLLHSSGGPPRQVFPPVGRAGAG